MRHATRSCVPLVSFARHQARRVSIPTLAGKTGTIALGGHRQLHLLSNNGFERNNPSGWRMSTSPTLFRPNVGALKGPGQAQSRFFKKANYIEKIGDNERTEDFLEELEFRNDKPDTRPSPKVLSAKGEKPSTERQDAKWSEDMTKGKQHFMAEQYSPANRNRENANDPIPTF